MNKNKIDSSELLTAFVNEYNVEQEHAEKIEQRLVTAELIILQQKEQIAELARKVTEQDADLITASKGIADAEKLQKHHLAKQSEVMLLKNQLKDTQQALTMANNAGLLKKQKEQIRRVKEASELKDKKISNLERKLNEANNDLTHANADKAACKKIVEKLKQKELKNEAQGLYHHGDHHLVIWPQKAEMLRPDGSTFQGTNLLYLHQSGNGAFITFDPQNNKSMLCPPPENGLNPSSEVKEFAHNWLFRVNQLQQGEIKDNDRVPLDYNN